MEQNRLAGKSRAIKGARSNKHHLNTANGSGTSSSINNDSTINSDITLILDNSLKKYAGEKFIVEHTKNVDRKFSSNK